MRGPPPLIYYLLLLSFYICYHKYNMIRMQVAGRIGYRFAIEKKLFVYDAGVRDGNMDYHANKLHSGVRATIFGASGMSYKYEGVLGQPIAAELGLANSSLIMPLSLDHNYRHSEQLK